MKHRYQRIASVTAAWSILAFLLAGCFYATTASSNHFDERDFHSYTAMTTALQTIATTYPDITALYDLGHSIQGRVLWGLKITDNPTLEEDEPEVRICGNHHGNEYVGAEMPLNLAQYLTDNYATNQTVQDLVDNREIWIIPMVNPDGHEAGSRGNANGVDLNRDYGYMWEAGWDSPSPFSQPETQAMRANAMVHNYVLSLSYHCSGDIVNFVWNYKHMSVPDVQIVTELSNEFASWNDYWVTDGYDWYQTRGDCNDFSYGCRGDLDWTIEIQSSNIDGAWTLNREAMIGIIEASDIGLRGIVTDASTGLPLNATIYVDDVYWPCYTDSDVGDYHRVLPPGTYTVRYRANGYQEEVREVTISDGAPTIMDVELSPSTYYYAYQVTMCNFYDPYSYPNNFQNNPTEAIAVLAAPDDSCASLGVNGMLVVDMGINITDGPDADFKVYEAESTEDGYQVSVSSGWNGPWTLLGTGTGVAEFDLQDASLMSARYVKIVDDGSGSPTESHPGADIDAVENLAPEHSGQPPLAPEKPQGPSTGFTFESYSFQTVAPVDPDGPVVYLHWEYGDNTTSDWSGPYTAGQQVSTSHIWSTPGVYLVKVKAKDQNGSESGYSAALTITIAPQPQIGISELHGGVGLSFTVHNQGAQNLTTVPWMVSVQGGIILISLDTSGQITALSPDESVVLRTGLILGFGKVTLGVTAGDGSAQATAFLLGPFLIRVSTSN